MTIQDIQKKLSEFFQGEAIELIEGAKNAQGHQVGDPSLLIPAAKIKDVCEKLKVIEQFSFDCLSNITAADWKDRFEVVYQLFSYKHRHSVTLRVKVGRGDEATLPSVPSLDEVWGCANWLEREVYDLFGINFEGHSDMRRIMLPEDWIGHPLRKDFKEQDDYHGIATTRPSLLN